MAKVALKFCKSLMFDLENLSEMNAKNNIEMGGITLVWDQQFLGWRIPGKDDVVRDKAQAAKLALSLSKIVARWEEKQLPPPRAESEVPIYIRSTMRPDQP